MSATTRTPTRRRGAESALDDNEVLDLVAAVARAVAAEPSEQADVPERVSMPAFNRVRPVVDQTRGVTDPRHPERTPSAEAIHLRFNNGAARKVSWAEIVGASLLEDRTMWLGALRRESQEPVAFPVVAYALKRVAAELATDSLDRETYRGTREQLIAEDKELWGEDGLLEEALPTVNQIEGQYGFATATAAVGLSTPSTGRVGSRRAPPAQHRGLALAPAMALYGALNGKWASRDTLRSFARASGFAVTNTQAAGLDWDAVIGEAQALLEAEGVTAPDPVRPKAAGRGKRLRIRVPVGGVPSAPPPRGGRRARDAGAPMEAGESPEVFAAKHELYVIAVRVWLAGLSSRDKVVRSAYVSWQRGTTWPSANRFDEGHGKFSGVLEEAKRANRAERRRGSRAVPKELFARAQELQTWLNPARQRALNAGASDEPGGFDFGAAVRAVLAGLTREVEV